MHNALPLSYEEEHVTTDYSDGTAVGAGMPSEPRRPTRRLSTETKASYKTTELFAYLAAAQVQDRPFPLWTERWLTWWT